MFNIRKNKEKMNATYTNSNYPRFNFLILIAVMLLLLIVSRKCAAQTVPVNKEVLNYLFTQNAKAYYLDKDVKLCDSINAYQKEIIASKDSIITGNSEAIAIRNSQNEICDMQLITAKAENKRLTKQVKILKPTGIALAIIAVAQYVKSRLD